jgi:hypothetical protein
LTSSARVWLDSTQDATRLECSAAAMVEAVPAVDR